MLHNTLSALLVSVASRYAQLSPSDVGIGIGGGRLVIDDVKLRAETFNSPRLPFYVHQGRAGRLRVNVPWSALSSSPVEVYLENVHLVAGPKQLSSDPHDIPDKPLPKNATGNEKSPWHQTAIGRLAFNVSIEMYGLKVEYRDASCVGIISIASLRAFSAGPDWNSSFVSLSLDPRAQSADTTTAVAMRKLVKLSGVHWVMIPRSERDETVPTSEDTHGVLDLDSFESQSPILDGIAITVKVLLCTGKASILPNTPPIPGLHAQIDVDLEDPNVNLTARQMKWIDHIMKQGLGRGQQKDDPPSSPLRPNQSLYTSTKRRPRSVKTSDSLQSSSSEPIVHSDSTSPVIEESQDPSQLKFDDPSFVPPPPSDTDSIYLSQPENDPLLGDYRDAVIDAEIEKMSEYDDDESYEDQQSEEYITEDPSDATQSKGVLFSFWQSIVGENSDETVDDAAIALGLSDAFDSPSENEGSIGGLEDDHADHEYARNAVAAAARAGGVSLQLRLRTPDVAAWDLVDRLRGEAQRNEEMRKRMESTEEVVQNAEARVHASEEKARVLRERNANLMREMGDLERLTGQAGRNKDAMIRQMEAALVKAERKLQEFYQERFLQQEEVGQVASPQVDYDDASLNSPAMTPAIAVDMSVKTSTGQETGQREMESADSVGGESLLAQGSQSEEERTVVEDAEESEEEAKLGNGYIEPQDAFREPQDEPEAPEIEKENAARSEQLPLVAPAPHSMSSDRVAKTSYAEKGAVLQPFSPSLQEIGLDNIDSGGHLSRISAHKLEEVMSSEGLTLI